MSKTFHYDDTLGFVRRTLCYGNTLEFGPSDDVNTSNALNGLDCVEERKKGKWEKQDANFVCNDVGLYSAAYKCNRCGKLNIAKTNYCPNCGADMRGENDV